jgi:hypothetical protein
MFVACLLACLPACLPLPPHPTQETPPAPPTLAHSPDTHSLAAAAERRRRLMGNKLPPEKEKKKHTLSLSVCVCASHRTNKARNNISNTATATTLQYGVCIDRCTDTHKNNNSNASGDLLLCITLSAHACVGAEEEEEVLQLLGLFVRLCANARVASL